MELRALAWPFELARSWAAQAPIQPGFWPVNKPARRAGVVEPHLPGLRRPAGGQKPWGGIESLPPAARPLTPPAPLTICGVKCGLLVQQRVRAATGQKR